MRLDADGDGKHDEVIKHVGYTTDIITDLALNWMKNKRDKDKPFMRDVPAQGTAPQLATGSKIPEQNTMMLPYRNRILYLMITKVEPLPPISRT